MGLLSAQQVTEVEKFKTIDVEVPEWGGEVRLQALTASDALVFLEFSKKEANREHAMLEIIRLCAVDETGARLFQKREDLHQKSLPVLLRLQRAAIDLNGFRKEAGEYVKNALGGVV